MILEPIKPEVLATRILPDADPQLLARLPVKPNHRSLGLITCTSDDALYTALDEGTKAAEVEVVYAKSFYAGASHASGPFSGEVIGIFAADEPDSVVTALRATARYLRDKAWFFAADDASRLAFFPHVIPSVGRYLAGLASVEPGTPMAYLIAPPIEAMLGIDAALKAARVDLKLFYGPPSETNFAGALLVGDVPSVEAAAAAFQATVLDLAARPVTLTPHPEVEELSESFGRKHTRPASSDVHPDGLPFHLHASGFGLASKPDGFTHLFDNASLVPKDHPAIRFRGKLDMLQAHVLDAALAARQEGYADIAADLDDVLRYLRAMLAAEVTGRPMPELTIGGIPAEDLHRISHNTLKFLNVGWITPDAALGPTAVKLNLLRAYCRDAEIAAVDAHGETGGSRAGATHLAPLERDRMLHGLNRLSNALYVLVAKVAGKK